MLDVLVVVQVVCWYMLDEDVNVFIFCSMDWLFIIWFVVYVGVFLVLLCVDYVFDFCYSYEGCEYVVDEVLEWIYMNVLLVIKDGKIVFEIYCNNIDLWICFIGWLMIKLVILMLVGCVFVEGWIKLFDDRIIFYLFEFRGGGYDGVIICQILQMCLGVDYDECYDFVNLGIVVMNYVNVLVKNVVCFVDFV